MAERRPERVAHLVQAELAVRFLRDANDRHLQQVAVTAVRMSPDLRLARVYFRTLEAVRAEGETERALDPRDPASASDARPGPRAARHSRAALRVRRDARSGAARLDELLRTGRDPSDDEKNR